MKCPVYKKRMFFGYVDIDTGKYDVVTNTSIKEFELFVCGICGKAFIYHNKLIQAILNAKNV